MNNNETLYGLDGQEELDSEAGQVLERVLDDAYQRVGESFDDTASHITWPVRVLVFRRMSVARLAGSIAESALEYALEGLDEEHADPGGNPTEPTEQMKDAARQFAEAVVTGYVSWACEPTGEVLEFTLEQARELLDEKPEVTK